MFLWFPVLDLARAPRRTARKKGSGYENGALYSIFSPSCSPKQGWKYVLINAFCRFKTLNLSFIPSVLSNIFKKQYTEKKWIQI